MVDKLKKYYEKGLLSKSKVVELVQCSNGKITTDDYTTIVGEAFPEGVPTTKVSTNKAISNLQNDTTKLNSKILALTKSNEFLEECLVEVAEIIYA